jgi:hypothetical protein
MTNLDTPVAVVDVQVADELEPPRKRARLSPSTNSPSTNTIQQPPKDVMIMEPYTVQTVMSDSGFQPEREFQVGILHFVNSSNPGFTGTLKQRYGISSSLLIFRFHDIYQLPWNR